MIEFEKLSHKFRPKNKKVTDTSHLAIPKTKVIDTVFKSPIKSVNQNDASLN